ncbi:Tho complex subunit 7 [Coniochaeta hoffmannii]|uniref:Tho complex subunit 7 n=1 Tax=Coniochaeta hoffmannii TaxID=91930 RepID=A0AA38SCN5_9PEZI|nr:Tho complex subunit 7 [Coniochaeta hoffmannii]
MSSTGWSLLDEKEEAELHKSRLLNVEEKPFKRITKRLQTLTTLAASAVRQQPTPPPEPTNGTAAEDGAAAAAEATPTSPTTATPADDNDAATLSGLREDIAMDFAAFDSSVARLQFLLTANARERERYAADRFRIQDTSRRVRDDTATLRLRLEEARATLEQRKRFDELAERIASNRALRPRAEQAAALAKLEEECAQLEGESGEYSRTWRERREQFEKIMEESMRLRRQIRDEKEEVERREGMDDDGSGAGGGAGEGGDETGTPRHVAGLVSGNVTPRPDSGVVAAKVGGLESGDAAGAGTPRASTVGGRTPAREGSAGPAEGQSQSLKVVPSAAGSFAGNGSRAVSREGSPDIGGRETRKADGGEDVEMGDAKGGAESPDSPLTPVPDDVKDDIPAIVLAGQDESQHKMDTT